MDLFLDSYSLLFRAFYALPPMNTSSGEPTSALYGTGSLLVKLLREQRPTRLAFALDGGRTFRHDAYDGYKAGRARTPDELGQQLARFGDLIAALGVPAHRVAGFEADDVLATLAAKSDDALVVSGDSDLLQVASPTTKVLFVGRRQKDHVLYDPAGVEARYGVPIAQIPSVRALVGDSSDNIPGLDGVGPKTAAKWVRKYGDVAGVVGHAAELGRHAETVEARAEDLPVWEDLIRLRSDLALEPPMATEPDLAGLQGFFEQLEMRSLVKRLDAL